MNLNFKSSELYAAEAVRISMRPSTKSKSRPYINTIRKARNDTLEVAVKLFISNYNNPDKAIAKILELRDQ